MSRPKHVAQSGWLLLSRCETSADTLPGVCPSGLDEPEPGEILPRVSLVLAANMVFTESELEERIKQHARRVKRAMGKRANENRVRCWGCGRVCPSQSHTGKGKSCGWKSRPSGLDIHPKSPIITCPKCAAIEAENTPESTSENTARGLLE